MPSADRYLSSLLLWPLSLLRGVLWMFPPAAVVFAVLTACLCHAPSPCAAARSQQVNLRPLIGKTESVLRASTSRMFHKRYARVPTHLSRSIFACTYSMCARLCVLCYNLDTCTHTRTVGCVSVDSLTENKLHRYIHKLNRVMDNCLISKITVFIINYSI